MTTSRIDALRSLVANLGSKQIEYLHFFPSFAGRLEMEFGHFLGSQEDVALCSASGPFDFNNGSYNHAGLGFEDGKYRVPLMIRLRNLKDDGDMLVRIRVLFTKDAEMLTAQIAGEPPLRVLVSDLTSLHEYIYHHLQKLLSEPEWFKQDKSDYQGTGVGFTQI